MRNTKSAVIRTGSRFVMVALIIISCNGELFGQFDEPIETERKMFTPTRSTVSLKETMFEVSYTYTDVRTGPETHSYPEMLTRYGLTPNIELRFGYNLDTDGERTAFGRFHISGEQDFLYGSKIYLTEQEGLRPESSLIIEGHTPKGGADQSQIHATYVFGWELPHDWSLDAAVLFLTDTEEGGDNYSEWVPSLLLNVPISERWETHWEYISGYSHGRDDEFNKQMLDFGLTHLVTENIEIGTRLGMGLNDDTPGFLFNVGGGFRF